MKRFLSARVMILVLLAAGVALVAAACSGSDGGQGPPGAQGAAGVQGSQGIQGLTGPQGIQGSQGIEGADGARGPQGPTGAQGDTGPEGGRGAGGARGPAGSAGLPGAPGPAGPTVPLNIVLSASTQAAGTLNVTVYGSGFTASSTVTLQLGWPDGSTSSLDSATANAGGTFWAALTTTTSLAEGGYAVWATDTSGSSATAPLVVTAAK